MARMLLQQFSSVLGVTGEKMELDGYNFLEGENLSVYDHMNKHTLATIVQLNENNEEAGHKVAMQVAAMKPVALDEASIPQSVKDEEFKVAVEKTKEEQIEKGCCCCYQEGRYQR